MCSAAQTTQQGWCEARTANSDDAFNLDGVFPLAGAFFVRRIVIMMIFPLSILE
jgi:hypothetical protein